MKDTCQYWHGKLYIFQFFIYHDHHVHDATCCFNSQDLVNLVQSNLNMLKFIKIHYSVIHSMYLFDHLWQSFK